MGLIVESLAEISPELERKYWIYLLNYGLQSELADAIKRNFVEIAQRTSKSQSVLIMGASRHFDDEVLRWDRVFGLSGDEHLPAILITTKNPHEFREHNWDRDRNEHEYILVPLRKLGATGDDAVAVLNSILRDVEASKPLAEFAIRSRLQERSLPQTVGKVLVLQPNFFGLGVDLKEVMRAIPKPGRRRRKGP